MTDYDLYAVEASSLEDAEVLVAGILSLEFAANDWSNEGPHLSAMDQGDEVFTLRENIVPSTGMPVEPRHFQHRFLLYIAETDRGEELRQALSAESRVRLLRHEIIGPYPPIQTVRV